MDYGLKGKRALVTGGSHGIGYAIAAALVGEGCDVAICARQADRLEAAAEALRQQGTGNVLTIAADLAAAGTDTAVLDTVTRGLGTPHILINNVGGGGRWGVEPIEANSDAVWLEVFEKNAMTAVRFTRGVIPGMRLQRWGRVVTITSLYGREGGGRPWFNLAKAAQMSLMKTLAMTPDLARDGITFNSVAPGPLLIPDTGWDAERLRDPDAFAQRVANEFVLGRLGTAEEVAAVATFLCSEQASLVNGACIPVDGGQSHAF